MYAIVECGGRQYRAEEGHSFSVEKLPQEVGEQIELDNVLLLSNDGNIVVGQPAVEGATVLATVTDQYRGKKIFVWKYKPKKRYRKRRGHRQYYTRLRIDDIVFGDSAALDAARAKAAERKAASDAEAAEAAITTESAETAPEPTLTETIAHDVEEVVERVSAGVHELEERVVEGVEKLEERLGIGHHEDDDAASDDAADAPEQADLSLTIVEGIGPKTDAALQAAGIKTVADLAASNEQQLRDILREAGISASPGSWVEQAKLAESGDMDALKALQDKLN